MINPDELKRELIEKYAESQDSIPEDEREIFKAYVEEGCEKNWVEALDAKAYGCYGGNDIFECDWQASLDCLLKLIELTDNPFYYNTIGYIYFYGRCNNGEPEYEKAFQYFAVGAAHGVYESMYKIADMFMSGKGCLKNPSAGAKIILSMYNDNKDIFCDDGIDGKFADVALRVAGLFEKGIGVDRSYEDAYRFYLEAKTAIDMRIETYDFFGDRKVQRNINEGLERVREKLPEDFFKDSITLKDPAPFGQLLSNSAGLDLTLETVSGGYKIRAKGFASEDASARILINMPEMGYCRLVNEIELTLDSDAEILSDYSSLPYTAFVTSIVYDGDEDVWNFVYRDMVMLAVRTGGYGFEK